MNQHRDDDRRKIRAERRLGYGVDCEPPDRDDRRKKWDAVIDRYRREWKELHEGDRSWTPWLVIRYGASDIGLRPMPASQPHWHSPDIWIESSDSLGRAVAGEPNFVHTRIFNLGKAAAMPTRVDFYWADPSVGLGPASMNLIGTEWVGIKAHEAVDVRCQTAWVPTFLNNGHECLMVNCTSPILDPITDPFSPRLDRHVGQRNITVINADEAAPSEMMFTVGNPFPFRATIQINASVRLMTVMHDAIKGLPVHQIVAAAAEFGQPDWAAGKMMARQFSPGTPQHRQALQAARFLEGARPEPLGAPFLGRRDPKRTSGAKVIADWAGEAWVLESDRGAAFGAGLLAQYDVLQAAPDGGATGAPLAATELGPFEQRQLKVLVDVPRDFGAADVLALEVNEWVADRLTGGYTVLGTRGEVPWARAGGKERVNV